MDKRVLLLYAITDGKTGISLCQSVEKALAGGVTIVQLRHKGAAEDDLIKDAKELKKVCARYGAPLIINDNVKVALRCADGVHLGLSDMSVKEARAQADSSFIIGATAKTIEQAVSAERAGADYLGSGAVFPSPTKTNAIRITPQLLSDICGAVAIPVVAIGGITEENMPLIKGCGASGAAVVSSLFGQEDIHAAASRLKALAELCFGVEK